MGECKKQGKKADVKKADVKKVKNIHVKIIKNCNILH